MDYETYIERNRKWNFVVNAADLSAVNLAKSFIFSTTVLTLYASYLTDRAFLIGLVPALQQVGYLLPQLFTARKSEQLRRKKPWVVKVSVFERLPYAFVTIGIFLFPQAPDWAAYVVLALSISIATGSAGLASPAWKAMLGKVIHPRRRGLLFGLGFSVGGFLGVGGSLISRHFLNSAPYPYSFAYCFLFSFIFQMVSWVFLTLNREPAKVPTVERQPLGIYLRALPAVFRRNPNFLRYLAGMYLIIMGSMSMNFYVVYAKYEFRITDGFAALLTLVAMVTQSAATPLLGAFGDRFGHKRLTQLGGAFGLGALGVMFVIPSPEWMYVVIGLMNLFIAGTKIAQASITMEFCEVDELPRYTAIAGTLLGIPTFFAPVVGGALLDAGGYTVLFAAAATTLIIGMAVLGFTVRDPRVE